MRFIVQVREVTHFKEQLFFCKICEFLSKSYFEQQIYRTLSKSFCSPAQQLTRPFSNKYTWLTYWLIRSEFWPVILLARNSSLITEKFRKCFGWDGSKELLFYHFFTDLLRDYCWRWHELSIWFGFYLLCSIYATFYKLGNTRWGWHWSSVYS